MKGTDKSSSEIVSSVFKLLYEERFRKLLIILLTEIGLLIIAGVTQRSVKYKIQIDEPASYDIKADKDFLVEDEVSTRKNIEKAEATVPFVYDYIPSMLTTRLSEIKKSILEVKEKKGVNAQKELYEVLKSKGVKLKNSTLGYILSEAEESFWGEVRFLLSSLHGEYVISENSLINRHISTGRNIKVRILGESGELLREEVVKKGESEFLDVRKTKQKIIKFVVKNKKSLRYTPYSLNVALATIVPNFFFNQGETLAEKKKILSNVKPVLYRVKKGEIIVRAGDRVTLEQWKRVKAMESLQHSSTNWRVYAGAFAVSIFYLLFGFYEFPSRFKKFRLSVRDISFVTSFLLITLFLSKIFIYVGSAFKTRFGWDIKTAAYFFLPIPFSVMLTYIVRGIENAFVFLIILLVSSALFLNLSAYIILFHFTLSILCIYFLTSKRYRTVAVKAGFRAGILTVIVVFGIYLLTEIEFSSKMFLYHALASMGGGVLSGILVAGILPLVETIFGYTTEIKFLELSYKDHPLLKELALRAKGSFQHSVMVSDLAEDAASAIGVNAFLAKVAGLYHDIGKVVKPHFYIENQDPLFNVHDGLTPSMSALVIMSHVKYGVELAKKYRLPEEIVDIIREHHGTSVVQYFYDKAMRVTDLKKEKPELSDFRYPGPKPRSKESGIIMIVDKVEAAVRSMEMPTHGKIKSAIDEIVAKIVEDDQLSECELSCAEISDIKKVLLSKLSAVYHRRVDYPSTLKKVKKEEKKVIQIGYGEVKDHNQL